MSAECRAYFNGIYNHKDLLKFWPTISRLVSGAFVNGANLIGIGERSDSVCKCCPATICILEADASVQEADTSQCSVCSECSYVHSFVLGVTISVCVLGGGPASTCGILHPLDIM